MVIELHYSHARFRLHDRDIRLIADSLDADARRFSNVGNTLHRLCRVLQLYVRLERLEQSSRTQLLAVDVASLFLGLHTLPQGYDLSLLLCNTLREPLLALLLLV